MTAHDDLPPVEDYPVTVVSNEEFDWLMAKLDEPPKFLPGLAALIKKRREVKGQDRRR